MRIVRTAHGDLRTPVFLPDATRGAVRAIDALDALQCGVEGLMMNSLHLSNTPGASVISSAGGLHNFTGWSGPIVTDSGGFQVYSLIAESPALGRVTARGFSYRFDRSEKKRLLTPERCVQKQYQLGSDIAFCLDHCTHPDSSDDVQHASVENTVEWARRGKEEMDRLCDAGGVGGPRPLLFAVVQGGNDPSLRRECAERLLEIGFDGYGYGGWPVGRSGGLIDMVQHVAELLPRSLPLHALGIGMPENVVRAHRHGYDIFDCVVPTREARHRRLYAFNTETTESTESDLDGDEFYHRVYIGDRKYVRDGRPVDAGCDCLCCTKYSRAYLHYLYNVDDHLAHRLATIHNLRFYVRLMDRLRRQPPAAGPSNPTQEKTGTDVSTATA